MAAFNGLQEARTTMTRWLSRQWVVWNSFKQHDVVRVFFFTRAQRAFSRGELMGGMEKRGGFLYTMHHVQTDSVSG